MKMALGIDPGLNGAFVLTDGKKVFEFRKMPLEINGKEKSIAYPEVCEILRQLELAAKRDLHVFLERAVPFAMGTKGAFNYGRGFAALEIAVQHELGVPFTMVEPNRWAKAMHEGITKDYKPKIKSALAVKRLFPKFWKKCFDNGKPHEGAIDALLIAAFGIRNHRLLTEETDIPDFFR